jgi:hypothetical protein
LHRHVPFNHPCADSRMPSHTPTGGIANKSACP